MQSFFPGSCHDTSSVLYKVCTYSLFASLYAEMLFLDDETDNPTVLASFPTTICCIRGDDGRLCSSRFMALPKACRERYGVAKSVVLAVELFSFMDCFDR